jgi:hypothetical protein
MVHDPRALLLAGLDRLDRRQACGWDEHGEVAVRGVSDVKPTLPEL